jgi:Pyridoxamine 5'-phosphate oxidase
MALATWAEFADTDPEFARFGEKRLSQPVAYLATIRSNGAPRLHPVSVHIADGLCFVYMEPTSLKAADLKRDDRFALHCAVEDSNGGNGEFGIRGSAFLIEDTNARTLLFAAASAHGFHPKDRYVLFELKIETAFSTIYDTNGLPQRKIWKP